MEMYGEHGDFIGDEILSERLPSTLVREMPDPRKIHYDHLMGMLQLLEQRLQEAVQFVRFAHEHASMSQKDTH